MIWDDTYYYKFEQAQSYLKEKTGIDSAGLLERKTSTETLLLLYC